MKIIKRNGVEVDFDINKIVVAISKANNEVPEHARVSKHLMNAIAEDIQSDCADMPQTPTVEEVQDMVENYLIKYGAAVVARAYITYRYRRELIRKANTTDKAIQELIEGESEYWNTENSNKKATLVTTQRDYIAGITSTDIAERFILPADIVRADQNGEIHVHDKDYMAQMALHNCCLVNLEDMLQNGTMINGVMIEKPHRFLTAMTIATQIITAVSSSQYGGVSVSMSHLAPFVRDSYNRYYNKYLDRGLGEDLAKKFAEEDTKKEIEDGVQTFNYQVNSMTTTNGQAPFLSVCFYLGETDEYKKELAAIIEEFLHQRIQGMKNEKGVYVTQAFPKLIYVLEEDNVRAGSPYYYLTELSAKCTAKRLVPDYVSEKVMKENKINKFGYGDAYPPMGCRSFLTPDKVDGNPARAMNYDVDKPKYYGRFNCGVITLSLPDLALSSGGDEAKFWELFEQRTELCRKAIRIRVDRLAHITADRAPILWQHGALARLDKGESIKPLLFGGYSTASLGYCGLYECVKYMTGKSHTDGAEGEEFAFKVMRALNDKCNQWKAEENIGYSLYGTPIESTTYKFSKSLKKRFGEDVFVKLDGNDRNYITNSYHVPVFENIDAFEKLALEAKFQALSPGGAISYVETPNLQNNVEAVLSLIEFIYETIMYAEMNTKSDYCMSCGYDGEMQVSDDMKWYCPNCGCKNQDDLYVTRRTCGYIGTQKWNFGRTQEIKERVLHVSTGVIDL
jgi:ribonucleoside-triphosphate reductase